MIKDIIKEFNFNKKASCIILILNNEVFISIIGTSDKLST